MPSEPIFDRPGVLVRGCTEAAHICGIEGPMEKDEYCATPRPGAVDPRDALRRLLNALKDVRPVGNTRALSRLREAVRKAERVLR